MSQRIPWLRGWLLLAALTLVPRIALAQGDSTAAPPSCDPEQGCSGSVSPGGENTPPTIQFSPTGTTVYSPNLSATITYCDNAGLNTNTRTVTLNGAALTTTWNVAAFPGCAAYAYAGAVLSLAPGANTLASRICDNAGACTTASATYTYDNSPDHIAPTVQLTPGTQTTSAGRISANARLCDERAIGTQRTVTFNGADVTASWIWSPQGAVTGCSSGGNLSATVQLRPGANTLAVQMADAAGNTGTQTVTWTYTPGVDASPTLQSGVRGGMSDVSVTYAMPAYHSLDADRGVTLVYSSFAARPTATVQVDVTDSSSDPAPVTSLGMLWNGAMQTLPDGRTELYYGTGAGTSRLTAVYGAASTPTRSMNMSAVITRRWTDGRVEQMSTPVRVLVVNQKDSEFGAGWTVAGVERVYAGGEGGILVTHGDATATFYPAYTTCNVLRLCSFGHAPGDFGTMVYDSAAARYVHTTRDGVTSTFNAAGYLTTVQDRLGNTQSYTYAGGRLSTITDPAGLVTTFAYDANGKLAGITDPTGRASTFQVSAAGDLVSITDPDGRVAMQLAYESSHRLRSYTDRGGRASNFTYDAFGKVATVQGPAFSAEGGQTFRMTATVTSPEAAAQGSLTGGTAAVPFARVNPATLRTSITDAQGRVTRYALDAWRMPARVENPRGYVSTTTRNAEGQVTAEVDEKGNATTYTWTGADLTRVASPTGVVDYGYNGIGQLTSISGSAPQETRWYGLATGLVDSTVVSGTDTTRYTYDARGRLLTRADPDRHVTTYAYPDTSPFRNLASESSGGRVTSYRYDAYGRQTGVTAPDGRETVTAFDLVNRTTTLTTPDQGQTVYAWGPLFLDQVTDPRGQVFSWTRNALGLVEREVRPGDAAGVNLTQEFDRYGRVTAVTNRRGQRVSVTYDAWDRVATRTADGQTTSFAYSPDDPAHPAAPAWAASASPESTDTLRVDASGRQTEAVTVRTIGGVPQRYVLQPHYDAYGRALGIGIGSAAGRDSVGFGYDAATWRMNALRDLGGGVTSFGYTRDGLPYTRTLPGGLSATSTYTSTHMPGAIRYSNLPLDGVAGVVYAYDAMNRVTERRNPTTDLRRSYAYSADGRWLSGYGDFAQSGSTHPTCGWDADNGYVCDDPQANWTPQGGDSYAYDRSGNPTDHGAVVGAGDRLAQFNGYTLTYDADGNLAGKTGPGLAQTFTWNSLGQLASVTTNGTTVSYGYDALGQRVRKTVNGADTHFLYMGGNLLMDVTAAGIQAKYTYDPRSGQPHSVVRNGGTYYYGNDAQGSVLALFTSGGTVVNSYTYLPFGEAQSINENPLVPNRIRYAGREFDTETGLYYNNARWYDPALHRFISQDPIGLEGGINPYAYVGNDPANRVDPSGLEMCINVYQQWQFVWIDGGLVVRHGPVWSELVGQICFDEHHQPTPQEIQRRADIMRANARRAQEAHPRACEKGGDGWGVHGAGVFLGIGAQASPWMNGAGVAGTASVSGGIYRGSNGSVNSGDMVTYGGMIGGLTNAYEVPGGKTHLHGAVAGNSSPGLTMGVYITNARSTAGHRGRFDNTNFNFGPIAIIYSWDPESNIKQLSVGWTVDGEGTSFSRYYTNTLTMGANGCEAEHDFW